MEPAFNGKLEEVQRLVSAGAIVDAADPEQRTSLMWAAFNGHTLVVGYLLEKGADLEAKDSNGRTALMYASSMGGTAVAPRNGPEGCGRD